MFADDRVRKSKDREESCSVDRSKKEESEVNRVQLLWSFNHGTNARSGLAYISRVEELRVPRT